MREFVSGPILTGARKRKCVRTAKIGPDLGLILNICMNDPNALWKFACPPLHAKFCLLIGLERSRNIDLAMTLNVQG